MDQLGKVFDAESSNRSDLSFLDDHDGQRWDEQTARERAPIDGEEAIRLLLKKYHTGRFYFRSLDFTWKRCIEIIRAAEGTNLLKGMSYSSSLEGGFNLPVSEEAGFCFRMRQPRDILLEREARFEPPASAAAPFAFAAYVRNTSLSEKGFPNDFDASMWTSDDVMLLKTRAAAWSLEEFKELRALFDLLGVTTYNSEDDCINEMLL